MALFCAYNSSVLWFYVTRQSSSCQREDSDRVRLVTFCRSEMEMTMAETDDIRFKTACDHFDAGEYFEAHEVWEDLWNEASGPRHSFLQCLIQVAVALHHARKENFVGTRKLFASSLQYLEKGKTDCDPIDLDLLRDRVLDFELALQEKLKGEPVELPYFLLPFRS